MRFSFARLTEADLPRLHGWLQQPHVREFYDDGLRSVEAVAAYYADVLSRAEPTHAFIGACDGTPIAFLQTYRIADHPAYAAAVQVGATDAGIDMLIGEPASAHRGLGAPLLRAFVDDVVWDVTGARTCWIGPSPRNPRARRAYEKSGFAYVKTVDVPGHEPEVFLRLDRSESA
jgi:RimJ/RimL family protein N-acetyltransferase